ncbi:hypothetical protein K438DRAFT_1786592 [Mycena galopus ATCC 62051]|nr:hypothetical protein K438DRAFT_1786592 [Mycena galopus ATCC 62051]
MLCATVTVWSCEQSQPLKGKKPSVPRLRRPNSGMGWGCPRRPCGAGAWAWRRGGTGQREPAGAQRTWRGVRGVGGRVRARKRTLVVDRGLSSSWHVPGYGRGWESVSRVQVGQSCGTSLWVLGVKRVSDKWSLYASGSGGTGCGDSTPPVRTTVLRLHESASETEVEAKEADNESTWGECSKPTTVLSVPSTVSSVAG